MHILLSQLHQQTAVYGLSIATLTLPTLPEKNSQPAVEYGNLIQPHLWHSHCQWAREM